MNEYILALDQGTTSSRAILFDKNLTPAAKAQREFTQILPKPGWVEHDAGEILQSQLEVMREALSGLSGSVAAVGITNQRETTVVWEKATGKPVYNAIVWQCRRSADICEELRQRGLEEYVCKTTGLKIDAYFSATKLKWLLDNVRGARERAAKGELLFGTVDTWLIYNLTGEHVTDVSNASRTMLFDIDKLCWDKRLLDELDIPERMLPRVLPSSGVFGYIKEGMEGLEMLGGVPVAGVAGDQQAALFGQRCFEAGSMKNTYGTGGFLMMNTGGRSIRSKNGMLSTIAWQIGDQVTYALEGSIFNAGSAIKWLRDEMGAVKTPMECDALAETVENTLGAYFIPAFTGLGAPYWDMYARGALLGVTRGFTRAHLCRAVLESIAYQVRDVLEAMETDSGMTVGSLKADGGAANSSFLMQFQADITGAELHRPVSVEATALGAALLAMLGVGIYKDTDEIPPCGEMTVFAPKMPKDERECLYSGWKSAVERIR